MRDGNPSLLTSNSNSVPLKVLEVTMRDGNDFSTPLTNTNPCFRFRSDYEGWKLTFFRCGYERCIKKSFRSDYEGWKL